MINHLNFYEFINYCDDFYNELFLLINISLII